MTSAAKIEANKRNAKRSTGPKTEAGKEKSRLNALKHGLTATTVVLPHEDAEAYARRVGAWTVELNPHGDLGRYLAERAARISWQLDRADAYERDRLARKLREAERQVDEGGAAAAGALLEKLYATSDESPQTGPMMSSRFAYRADSREPDPEDELSALLKRLEATAGGSRRLLEE